MSIFKTKWIVLKKEKLKENEFIYTIFTYDYWKIKTIKKESKKEKTLDLWYILNFEIYLSEKSEILKIRNIKIIWEFKTESKTFSEINSFLELLNIVQKNVPEKVSIYEIYLIFESIKGLEKISGNVNKSTLSEEKLILARLKVLNILWILGIDNKNELISRILRFINNNNIKSIFKLTWITTEIKNELNKI